MDPWNAPAHRYFIACRAEGTFRQVMGLSVIDEFATVSSPIFLAPESILGKIYNAGISLGHYRDPEMGIDLGWPPLCIGTSEPAPELSANWESELLNRIQQDFQKDMEKQNLVEEFQLQKAQIADVDVYATDAPLLPKQLKRICQLSSHPFSIAFAVGNVITPQKDARALTIEAVSESLLKKILDVFREL
jgi:hypothetical protein